MRGIAERLKRQRLKQEYPEGVTVETAQRGRNTCVVIITNLKNGSSKIVRKYSGYLAILLAGKDRDALRAGFEDAGIKVEK